MSERNEIVVGRTRVQQKLGLRWRDPESRAPEMIRRWMRPLGYTPKPNRGEGSRKSSAAATVRSLSFVAILLAATIGCRTHKDFAFAPPIQGGPTASTNATVTAPPGSEQAGEIPFDVLDSERKLAAGDRVTFRI